MKDPRWKQEKPSDQFLAILMALEGGVEMLEKSHHCRGPIDTVNWQEYVDDCIEQMRALHPFLEKGSW